LITALKLENNEENVKTLSEIVILLTETDFYDVILPVDSESGSIEIISNYCLSEKTKETISNYEYLPPLVVKPARVTSNIQKVYYSKKESVLLGQHNHHNEYLNLNALNIANSTALSLDADIINIEETPNKVLDTFDKRRAFDLMKKTSNQIYADILENDNKFYFTWKFDFRGRMYSSGYHINIQGTEYKKALISLAKPIKLND